MASINLELKDTQEQDHRSIWKPLGLNVSISVTLGTKIFPV